MSKNTHHRRHHNNAARRSIQNGATVEQVAEIARKLNIPTTRKGTENDRGRSDQRAQKSH